MSAPAQASTRDALLSLLLERGDAEAADLAQDLSLSVQVIRRHLRSLADDGLAQACASATGPGRTWTTETSLTMPLDREV